MLWRCLHFCRTNATVMNTRERMGAPVVLGVGSMAGANTAGEFGILVIFVLAFDCHFCFSALFCRIQYHRYIHSGMLHHLALKSYQGVDFFRLFCTFGLSCSSKSYVDQSIWKIMRSVALVYVNCRDTEVCCRTSLNTCEPITLFLSVYGCFTISTITSCCSD